MALNTTNILNLFQGETPLKHTIFLFLKSGVELPLIGLRIAFMEINFSTLKYIEWATYQTFCVPDKKKEKSPFSFLRETLGQYGKAFG